MTAYRLTVFRWIGILSLLLSAIAWMATPNRFYVAWFASLNYWIEIPLGAMALLLMTELTGGEWIELIRSPLVRLSKNIWFLAIAAFPILFGYSAIWKFGRSGHEEWYVSPVPLLTRALVYFILWGLAAALLSKNSRRGKTIAAIGLIIYALSSTFAAMDWLMCLQPHWSSTAFGMIAWSRQGLAGLTAAVLLTDHAMGRSASKHDLRNLGNLLLALVMGWSYLSFIQLLVSWSGNLSETAMWFVQRITPAWRWPVVVVTLFQIVLPILFLLFRRFKESVPQLKRLALTLCLCRVLEVYWLILPSIDSGEMKLSWVHLTAFLAIGGLLFV